MDIKAPKTNIKEVLNQILLNIHILPLINAVRTLWTLEVDLGHFKSSYKWQSIDNLGNPIPWFTYPAVSYLKKINLSNMSVFEYGSGNSTLYWARAAKSVASVENDKLWFKRSKTKLHRKKNVTLIYTDKEHEYVQSIAEQPSKFDLIVIDGAHREACAKTSIKKLSSKGLIILDNSELYPNISKYFRQAGLTQIDFSGFGPINPYEWTTSFFLTKGFKPSIIN